MKNLKPLLITLFSLWFFSIEGFSQCKEINIKANITHTSNGQDNGSIEIQVPENLSANTLVVNLFGPRRNNRLGLSELVINDLKKGEYLVVVSGRKEENDFCPVSINVTIN